MAIVMNKGGKNGGVQGEQFDDGREAGLGVWKSESVGINIRREAPYMMLIPDCLPQRVRTSLAHKWDRRPQQEVRYKIYLIYSILQRGVKFPISGWVRRWHRDSS